MILNLSYTPLSPSIQMNIEKQGPSPEETFLSHLYEILAEKAFDSQYTVPKLCRDIGMSSSRLYRKLRSITGKSVIEIIVGLRLEKAKQLLIRQPDCSITQIAYDCGFEDPDYFSRAFSKQFGVSPSGFRKMGIPPTTSFSRATT